MEGPLKILMTADTVGGVWTYALGLCKGLEKYNTEVHLATMGNLLNQEQYRQVLQLNNVYLHESNYKLEWMQNSEEDRKRACQWIRNIYKQIKPHLLHFNNYGQVDGSWQCPVVTVYHSCVQTWWQAVKGEDAPPEWHHYMEVVQKALYASDTVVAPSSAIMDAAENTYGSFKHKKVIYNGRKITTAHIQQKEPFILSAGRIWDEAKNIKLLSVIAKRLPWQVVIAGDNIHPDTGDYPELENIHFLGKLTAEDMQNWMCRASIFVMPAKYEPFGLAILEAAKSGCALALAAITTLREIWAESAVFFEPDDDDEAVLCLLELIENNEYRNAMAEKALKHSKDYTQKRMAAEYMDLYKQLLN